jgi:hypothetical protein
LQRLANPLACWPDVAQHPEVPRAKPPGMILRSAALFDQKGNGKAINNDFIKLAANIET